MNETAGLGVRKLSTQLSTPKSVHTRLRKVRTLLSRQCLCLNGILHSKRVVVLGRTPECHDLQACIRFAGFLFWDSVDTPLIILRKRPWRSVIDCQIKNRADPPTNAGTPRPASLDQICWLPVLEFRRHASHNPVEETMAFSN